MEEDEDSHVHDVHSCLVCAHLPPEQHCIRVKDVRAHPVGKTMKDTVLTLAEEDDILPPKVCM